MLRRSDAGKLSKMQSGCAFWSTSEMIAGENNKVAILECYFISVYKAASKIEEPKSSPHPLLNDELGGIAQAGSKISGREWSENSYSKRIIQGAVIRIQNRICKQGEVFVRR